MRIAYLLLGLLLVPLVLLGLGRAGDGSREPVADGGLPAVAVAVRVRRVVVVRPAVDARRRTGPVAAKVDCIQRSKSGLDQPVGAAVGTGLDSGVG